MRDALRSVLVAGAGAVLIVTVAVLPFLTPPWVSFEQGRAEATAWTGYTVDELNLVTGSILSDLVFGPPDFDVDVRGEAVLNERERGHMRDVRTVFLGLWVAAGLSVLIIVAAFARGHRPAVWRAVRRGAVGLAVVVVGLGVVALLAFDVLFEVFHRILFPGGSYTFDPSTERLVQLFPFRFWQESAMAVGVTIVVLALLMATLANRGADAAQAAPTLASAPEPSR